MDWFVILRGAQWPLVAKNDFHESTVPGCWETRCDDVDPNESFVVLTKRGDRFYVPAADVVVMAQISDVRPYGFLPLEG